MDVTEGEREGRGGVIGLGWCLKTDQSILSPIAPHPTPLPYFSESMSFGEKSKRRQKSRLMPRPQAASENVAIPDDGEKRNGSGLRVGGRTRMAVTRKKSSRRHSSSASSNANQRS